MLITDVEMHCLANQDMRFWDPDDRHHDIQRGDEVKVLFGTHAGIEGVVVSADEEGVLVYQCKSSTAIH
jgi:transcription antitermination factor NusG